MPLTLVELEQLVHQVVRDEVPLGEGAAALGVDPDRLSIYRRFVHTHIRTALEANFSLLQSWLGEPNWTALVEGYRAAHPPSHWGLNEAAAQFTAWLVAQVEAGAHGLTPAHQALAELEWALYETQADPTRIPRPEDLDAPALNPTLQVMSLTYPIVPVAVDLTHGETPEMPEAAESMVLVYRRPGTEISAYHTAEPNLLFAIKMLHDGLSVAAVAESLGAAPEVVEGVLRQAAQAGVAILPG